MIRSALRRILTVLALATTLLSSSTLHATPLREPASVPGFLAWLHDTLAVLWTIDEGGGLDPNGRSRTNSENGGGLDPSGRPGLSSVDEGGGLDPSGRSALSSVDNGGGLDPDGR